MFYIFVQWKLGYIFGVCVSNISCHYFVYGVDKDVFLKYAHFFFV